MGFRLPIYNRTNKEEDFLLAMVSITLLPVLSIFFMKAILLTNKGVQSRLIAYSLWFQYFYSLWFQFLLPVCSKSVCYTYFTNCGFNLAFKKCPLKIFGFSFLI